MSHATQFQRSTTETKFGLGSPNIAYTGSFGDGEFDMRRSSSIMERSRLSMSDWWMWEIICTVASLASWIAVCVVLAHASNKPQDRWTSSISINAVISALVLVARATMMVGVSAAISQSKWLHFKKGTHNLYDMHVFDSASRGVLGSFRLLFRIRWQLSTIGALVTILSMAVDPFAQQVIEVDARLVGAADGTATIGVAHSYWAGAQPSAFNLAGQPDPITADLGMQGAIYRALFNLTDDIKEPYTCPGSCSWSGPFISMGFRSNCQNVTLATLENKVCNRTVSNAAHSCNMTTPGGVRISTILIPTDMQSATVVNTKGAELFDESLSGNDFLHIAIWRAPPETYNFAREIVGEEITECTLSVTAYEYSNIAANGTRLSQTIRELPLQANATRPPKSPTANDRVKYYLFDEPGLPQFNMSQYDWGAIVQFFQSKLFVGTLLAGNQQNTDRGIGALSMSKASNLTETFELMARSMTNQLRATAPGTIEELGLTNRAVGFVRIRWYFLALPLTIALASAVLLAAMIFHNRRSRGVPLYKFSPVPLLYAHINEPAGAIVGPDQSPRTLERLSETLKLRLK